MKDDDYFLHINDKKRQCNHIDAKIFLEHAIEFLAIIDTQDKEIQINLQIADRLITKAITVLEANDGD